MYDQKKNDRIGDKKKLISVKFSMNEYQKIKKVLTELSITTIDLSHTINEFGTKAQTWWWNYNSSYVWSAADDLKRYLWYISDIFFVDFFKPLETSKIINNKKLSRKTIEKTIKQNFNTRQRKKWE